MWIPQLPRGWEWNHNAHYHPWMLRQLPPRPQRALDIGCGAGTLARILADHVDHVDALDRSPVMIEQARQRRPVLPHLTFVHGDLLDPDGSPLPAAGYDVVTAVASLHHMPLAPAVKRMAALVRPGGVLVVVGLYRSVTVTDHALDLVGVVANGAVGAARALIGRPGKPDDSDMPVMTPTTTRTDIRGTAAAHLPGATLRRGLFFRYLLRWRRPGPDGG